VALQAHMRSASSLSGLTGMLNQRAALKLQEVLEILRTRPRSRKCAAPQLPKKP